MLHDVLGRHITSHVNVFAEMRKTQTKSLKGQAICIRSAKQDKG